MASASSQGQRSVYIPGMDGIVSCTLASLESLESFFGGRNYLPACRVHQLPPLPALGAEVEAQGVPRCAIASLTFCSSASVVFLASPSNMSVFSMKKTGFSMSA